MPINYFSRRCVEGCEQFGAPSCPVCPTGQICSLLAPTCDECQRTVCVAQSAAPPSISSIPKPSNNVSFNTGAIVGGALAGVTAVIIISYIIWHCCNRGRRSPPYTEQSWSEYTDDSARSEKSFNTRRDARASTHTVTSLASSVFTRASNVIQIAYIPGVSNRSGPTTPGFLVPPVPPIPLALTSNYGSTPSLEQEHFFMPSDLRDSTCSSANSQISFERNSVASTIYDRNAIVSHLPAQRGILGKAAVVSVKSTATLEGAIPPIPNFDYYETSLPSPAFSVGSTFLSRASEATLGKAQMIRVRNNSLEQRCSSQTDLVSQSSQPMSFIDTSLLSPNSPFNQALSPKSRKYPPSDLSKPAETPFGDENQVKEI